MSICGPGCHLIVTARGVGGHHQVTRIGGGFISVGHATRTPAQPQVLSRHYNSPCRVPELVHVHIHISFFR